MDAPDTTGAWIRRTTPLRVFLGLMGGAGAGGAVITVFYVIGRQAETGLSPLALALETPLAWLLLSFAWLIGMTALGGPFWWLLHRIGWRGWPWLTALGALAPCVVIAAIWLAERLSGGHGYGSTRADLGEEAGLMFAFGAVGAISAWTVWRIAYRRRPPRDVASVFT